MDLVDWIGRAVRVDKRGAIPPNVPPILHRLGIDPGNCIETVQHFRRHFFSYVGCVGAVQSCPGAQVVGGCGGLSEVAGRRRSLTGIDGLSNRNKVS
jgi:hypothetical protein